MVEPTAAGDLNTGRKLGSKTAGASPWVTAKLWLPAVLQPLQLDRSFSFCLSHPHLPETFTAVANQGILLKKKKKKVISV